MFTLDTNKIIKAQLKGRLKTVIIYLILSVSAIAVDNIYALFGHGVRSASMSLMFLYPLLGGALFFLLLGFITPNIGGMVYRLGYNLYNSGIATLTAGSLFKGILDIAGTASGFSGVFIGIGWAFVVTGICMLIAAAVKGGNHIEKSTP